MDLKLKWRGADIGEMIYKYEAGHEPSPLQGSKSFINPVDGLKPIAITSSPLQGSVARDIL